MIIVWFTLIIIVVAGLWYITNNSDLSQEDLPQIDTDGLSDKITENINTKIKDFIYNQILNKITP